MPKVDVEPEVSQVDKVAAIQAQLAEAMQNLTGQDAIKAAKGLIETAKAAGKAVTEANKAQLDALNEYKANLFASIADVLDVPALITYLTDPLVQKNSVNITGKVDDEELTVSIRWRSQPEEVATSDDAPAPAPAPGEVE